jgi:hypothetical protein
MNSNLNTSKIDYRTRARNVVNVVANVRKKGWTIKTLSFHIRVENTLSWEAGFVCSSGFVDVTTDME